MKKKQQQRTVDISLPLWVVGRKEKKNKSTNNKNLCVENLFAGLKTYYINIKSSQPVFEMVKAALLKEDKLRW